MENITSFHKTKLTSEDKDELIRVLLEGKRDVIAFPRPWEFMPQDIANLLRSGISENLEIEVYENLTLEDENLS